MVLICDFDFSGGNLCFIIDIMESEEKSPPIESKHRKPYWGIISLFILLIGCKISHALTSSSGGWSDIDQEIMGILIGLAALVLSPILACLSFLLGEKPWVFALITLLAETYVIYYVCKYLV
jgi:hypothetical protein